MARWPRAVGNWGVKAQAERPRVQGRVVGIRRRAGGAEGAAAAGGSPLLPAPKPMQAEKGLRALGSALCWGPRARPVLAPFVLHADAPQAPGVQLGFPVPSNGPLLSLPRSYIYQKRWVKLDADYLRYFDSEKVRGEEG